jgi:hypothetical protein
MRVIRVLCVVLASVFFITQLSVSAQIASPRAAKWAMPGFAPFAAEIDVLSLTSVFPTLAAPDDTDKLLAQWAKDGSADQTIVDRLMLELNIMSKQQEADLIAKLRDAGTKYSGGPSAFEEVVRETLDKRRYARVDEAVQEVLNAYGKDLEAVIRTGSSGKRYLQIRGSGDGGTGYRTFFSDDDISFVGPKAEEAARMLNGILENQGLAKLKVKGMDLGALKNIRGIDLTALNLLEPDKFLGESGIASIKGEMLDKGAVIAERSGESMAMTARPLRQFVEAKKSRMLADLMDDSAVRATVQKFGALTVVGSCERQIVQTHAGWANLPDSEKVKYVLRQRFALSESGAMRNVAGEAASVTAADIAKLNRLRNELKIRTNLTPEELSWLNTLRAQNIDLAFKEIPQKLAPVIAVAETSGRSVASNPEVRRMMNELTTGFALMRDRVIDIPHEEMIAKLKSMAGENKELYTALYTSFQQSKDLVEALDQWIASGGTREAFIDMLVKSEGRLARLQQVIARRAKKPNSPEAKTLTALEEMLGTDLGDNFFMKMARNPAAKKVVLAAMSRRWGRVPQRDVSVVDEGQFPGGPEFGGVRADGLCSGRSRSQAPVHRRNGQDRSFAFHQRRTLSDAGVADSPGGRCAGAVDRSRCGLQDTDAAAGTS